jgi:hypothetical protein
MQKVDRNGTLITFPFNFQEKNTNSKENIVFKSLDYLISFLDSHRNYQTPIKYDIVEVISKSMSTKRYHVLNLTMSTELNGKIIVSEYIGNYDNMRILNMFCAEDITAIEFKYGLNEIVVSLVNSCIIIQY